MTCSRLAARLTVATTALATFAVPVASAHAASPAGIRVDTHRVKILPPRAGGTSPAARAAAGSVQGDGQLSYHGGNAGIGVMTAAPRVYLVFWGNQWGTVTSGSEATRNLTFSNDQPGVALRVQQLLAGIGTNNETWSGVTTQYCEGVAAGETTCPSTARHVGYATGGALAGVWYDSASTSPSQATIDDIGQEAANAAAHFQNTTAASNRNTQYVVLSPTGTHPDGFQMGGAFCAWHSWASTPYGVVAFTNLPYLPDVGWYCGANFVHSDSTGVLDGVSIVEGHEYAETVTDPIQGGWWDAAGEEIADKCSWISSGGPDGIQDVAFSTGTFPMQSLYSNGSASCEISHPVVTSTPLAPTGVTALSGANQETLSWQPPDADGGSPITGYLVSRDGTDQGGTGPWSTTVSATTRSLTFKYLNGWTHYTLQVAAINAVGTGAPAWVTIFFTAPTPAAPTGVTASAADQSATVQWTAPTQTGTSAITGYRIRRFAGTTNSVQSSTTVPATATSYTLTGLTNGSTYSFDVTAINASGIGANSTRSNSVSPFALEPPDAPASASASTNASAKSATVTWTPPGYDGGSAITGYRVSRDGVDSGGTGPWSTTVAASTRSFTFSHLNAWETYTLSVQAINAYGTGPASAQAVLFTAATPGPATEVSAARGNRTATVTWIAPTQTGTSAITGYRIRRFAGTSTTVQATTTVGSAARTFTATGLTNGSTYSFDVSPINSSGIGANSTRSNAVVPATVPNAPIIGTAVAGVAGGAITATAKWSAPSVTGGSVITGYKVTALRMSSTGTVLATTVSTVLASTLRQYAMTLPVAGNYRFTVQAVNAVGPSAQSARSNQVAGR